VNTEQRAQLIELGAQAIANVRAARWKQLVGDEHERVRSLFVEHESDQQRVEAEAVIDALWDHRYQTPNQGDTVSDYKKAIKEARRLVKSGRPDLAQVWLAIANSLLEAAKYDVQ